MRGLEKSQNTDTFGAAGITFLGHFLSRDVLDSTIFDLRTEGSPSQDKAKWKDQKECQY
jgi:hypothetical protein